MSIKYLRDLRYDFECFFDSSTGMYVRSGMFENDLETNENPFRATFPHLIDVGIMGHCTHGLSGLCEASGVGCYQNGKNIVKENMSLTDFKYIVEQSRGLAHQFALGGRGDPDEHKNFEEILKICKDNEIVPNYTTSGYTFTKEKAKLSKKYCGAVAVSWYRNSYTLNTINLLLNEKVKVNIHYVLGKNTIQEAIENIEKRIFPKVNAIIFLLHKPIGLGKTENILSVNDPIVKRFFNLLTKDTYYRFGIDSCSVPGMLNLGNNYDINSLDTCEAGRFSCYISSDLWMVPCSFDVGLKHKINLRESSIQEAFDSNEFEYFRQEMNKSCLKCMKRKDCLGGCSLMPGIVLCNSEKKEKGELVGYEI